MPEIRQSKASSIEESQIPHNDSSALGCEMTEVEVPAPPPVKEQKDAMDTTPTEQEPKATQNGNTESATIDAIKSSEDKEQAPVLAHSKDREEHESTRVKEARQYNNRDRDRYSRGNYHNSNYKKNYTRNNKFDPSALPKSDDPIQIRKQVNIFTWVLWFLLTYEDRILLLRLESTDWQISV